jgi:XrtJ-associated TM-motif-TM protein
MFPRFHYLLAASSMAVVVSPLYAQGGCLDSPESPTIVLAGMAAIAALAVGIRAMRRRKA